MVIAALNPFYKKKKFESKNPKELFKDVARNITHRFLQSHLNVMPTETEVKEYILEVFYHKGIIRRVEDLH